MGIPQLIAVALSATLTGTPTPPPPSFPPSPQTAPGTSSRPILTTDEAAPFTPENYFAYSGLYDSPAPDPWRPTPVRPPSHPDFVVVPATSATAATSATTAATAATSATTIGGGSHGGPRVFTDVQEAVDAAYLAGGTDRLSIAIRPGTYTGTVFIPAGTPPLTLYGTGRPEDVNVEFTLDATITPAQWAAQVNAANRYAEGDPAWPMYQACATKTTATAALCATVVWSQSTDVQFANFTITNTLLDTVDSGTHQALALRTDADRTQIDTMRIISRQDTLMTNADDTTRIARASIRDSYIEGDTDFVFGRAAAVFTGCTFRLVSSRKPSGGVIFAPNTAPAYPYGFLVLHSRLEADAAYAQTPTGHFGRAWDQGASATGYLPGITPNGQLVLRDSYLAPGFAITAPWSPAATTSRPFSAPATLPRSLTDPLFNRLWEYANHGPSAQTS
ncbi:pectinesterase family protein [Actinoplanes sp. NPDC051851]|uniref:pectinesterase family protein n=1 Tax=Actinoplanes sp. NPDC051851 TaxID=3154753 RepID=UPI003413DC08